MGNNQEVSQCYRYSHHSIADFRRLQNRGLIERIHIYLST